MPFKFEVRANFTPVNKQINAALRIVGSLKPYWGPVVDQVIQPGFENVFETDGFGTWKPRVSGGDHDLLRDTLNLFRSLTQTGHPNNIDQRGSKRLRYGTSVRYAQRQDRERPIIRLLETSETEKRIERLMLKEINKRLEELR